MKEKISLLNKRGRKLEKKGKKLKANLEKFKGIFWRGFFVESVVIILSNVQETNIFVSNK